MVQQVVLPNGRKIGWIDQTNKVYKKSITPKHIFKSIGKKGAIGIDNNLFQYMKPDNYTIKVTFRKRVYVTDCRNLEKFGKFLHFKSGEVDYGTQILMDLECWTKEAK